MKTDLMYTAMEANFDSVTEMVMRAANRGYVGSVYNENAGIHIK